MNVKKRFSFGFFWMKFWMKFWFLFVACGDTVQIRNQADPKHLQCRLLSSTLDPVLRFFSTTQTVKRQCLITPAQQLMRLALSVR